MKIEENKTGWVITPETNTEVLVSQIVIDLLDNAHVFENIELVIQDIVNKELVKIFTRLKEDGLTPQAQDDCDTSGIPSKEYMTALRACLDEKEAVRIASVS